LSKGARSSPYSESYPIMPCAVKSSFKTSLQISLSRDQSYRLPELEFLKSLWGLGTEEE
jgi:hypothetical protein